MTRSAVKTEAFVLRTVDYGDSDRIFTLFTREQGKIAALARGVRKSTKRFGGALVPFALMDLILTQGTGELWYVREAELKQANEALSRHLTRIGVASFVLEVIRESVPEHTPDVPLFECLSTLMPLIGQLDTGQLPSLSLAAALRVLATNGIGVSLDRCSACGASVPPNRPVLFHPGRGGVVCSPCGGGPIRLEAASISGLIRLASAPISSDFAARLSDAALGQCEEAVSLFIEHHLGRRLKTRALGPAAPGRTVPLPTA